MTILGIICLWGENKQLLKISFYTNRAMVSVLVSNNKNIVSGFNSRTSDQTVYSPKEFLMNASPSYFP